MQIQMTGQHMEITPAIREYVEKKMKRVNTDRITHIHFTFRIEKLAQIAEGQITVPGSNIHADAKSENMYESIDKLIDKLDRQLKKYKEKLTDHK